MVEEEGNGGVHGGESKTRGGLERVAGGGRGRRGRREGNEGSLIHGGMEEGEKRKRCPAGRSCARTSLYMSGKRTTMKHHSER